MSCLKNNWISIIAMTIAITALLFDCKHCFLGNEEKIVGVWLIDAFGAPFQPHIATFHSDKTMEIHNPEAGDPHTSGPSNFCSVNSVLLQIPLINIKTKNNCYSKINIFN